MKPLRTIVSLSLAVVVLVTSVSPSINFHLCAGRVQSVAIFGKAKSCGGHVSTCNEAQTKNAISKTSCCQNATVLLSSDLYSSLKDQVKTAKPQVISFCGGVSPYLIVLFKGLTRLQHSHYKPPSIARNITLLVRTFLI